MGVLEMSGEELEEVQRKLSRSALIQKIPGEPASQAEARKVVSVQSSSRMTSFKVRGTPNTAYLPGGAPLVDHLHQRVEYMPDFNCLSPAIDKLRNHRLPDKRFSHTMMEWLSPVDGGATPGSTFSNRRCNCTQLEAWVRPNVAWNTPGGAVPVWPKEVELTPPGVDALQVFLGHEQMTCI